MLLLTFFKDEIFVTAVSLLFGLGMSFSTVATSAYTGDVADKTKLGAAMGALSSVMDVGHSSGPLQRIRDHMVVHEGRVQFLSFALCTVVAFVFVLSIYRRKRYSPKTK